MERLGPFTFVLGLTERYRGWLASGGSDHGPSGNPALRNPSRKCASVAAS